MKKISWRKVYLIEYFLLVVILLLFNGKCAQNADFAPNMACIDTITITDGMYNVLSNLDSIGGDTISDERVQYFLGQCGVQHPHIVYAQMRLESANFTSALAKSNNNYFGMKHARKRPTFSIGEKKGYATYRNWVYSILDYAMWQKHYAYNLSEKEYLERLKNYATDKNYIEKVKKLQKVLEVNKKGVYLPMQRTWESESMQTLDYVFYKQYSRVYFR